MASFSSRIAHAVALPQLFERAGERLARHPSIGVAGFLGKHIPVLISRRL